MQYKGVMFDMDGLLLDTERLVVDSFQRTAAGFDLADIGDVVVQMIGLRADSSDMILRHALNGRMDQQEFSAAWQADINVVVADGIPLKSGVVELLELLAAQGLPCVVATSTRTKLARHHLGLSGIIKYFQYVIGGEQVDHGKPAPDIYHKAAEMIGLMARDCVAFEDSDPGATAAISSGAKTVQVPDINQPSAEMRQMGHLIAPNLLDGARKIGLIS